MNVFEKLEEAKKVSIVAANAVIAATAKVESVKDNLRRVLTVGANKPIAVGILPNGKVAVVVKTDDSKANQLKILEAVQLNDNGNIVTEKNTFEVKEII